jgi:murein DD-endopeptidase MepM/ murein hydrolase activator NlpD
MQRRGVAFLLAALLAIPATAQAQVLPLGESPSSSTTTTTSTPPGGPTAASPPANGTGDGAPPPAEAGSFPAELQAMVDSVRRTRANNTRALTAALAPLERYGLDATQRAVVGFGRFPVAGVATWSDDWWFPRFGPGWRLHLGLDIFAPAGTPVRAPVDGTVDVRTGGLGGLSVYLRQPDGTYWYLAHLAGLGPNITSGLMVRTGDVVGYVGDSGNARGGLPHLHFEVHPRGGPAVPPKPVVDRFVADALALAPQVVAAYARAYQPAQPAPPAPEPMLAGLTADAAVLWMSALSPTAGTFRLVEAAALDAASRIDWSQRR